MYLIIAYLLFWLLVVFGLWTLDAREMLPDWLMPYRQAFLCCLIAAVGGIVYCLRGVYINRPHQKEWNGNWNVWYYLRPPTSFMMGGVTYVFLKAGLLVLDANPQNDNIHDAYGFYAMAFIAGLNVSKFIKKIEDVARAVWGIEPSRTSAEDTPKNSS